MNDAYVGRSRFPPTKMRLLSTNEHPQAISYPTVLVVTMFWSGETSRSLKYYSWWVSSKGESNIKSLKYLSKWISLSVTQVLDRLKLSWWVSLKRESNIKSFKKSYPKENHPGINSYGYFPEGMSEELPTPQKPYMNLTHWFQLGDRRTCCHLSFSHSI